MTNYKVVDSDKLDSDLKRLADIIRLKGGTIADLSFPEGMQQAVQDIQAGTVIPEGYIKPSGSKTITENGKGIDVAQFATVDVEVAGGGGSGECSGEHVIIVDELPTQNIDKTALYRCGESYYRYEESFVDLIMYDGGAISFLDMITAQGASGSLNVLPTKTTEGILSSDMSTQYHFYYIADENDVFIYIDDWYSLSAMGMTNGGVILDISQATTDGCYYVLASVWEELVAPSGGIKITKNGTHNVSQYANVIVEIPSSYMVQTVDELPTNASNGSLAIVLRG